MRTFGDFRHLQAFTMMRWLLPMMRGNQYARESGFLRTSADERSYIEADVLLDAFIS